MKPVPVESWGRPIDPEYKYVSIGLNPNPNLTRFAQEKHRRNGPILYAPPTVFFIAPRTDGRPRFVLPGKAEPAVCPECENLIWRRL